MLKYLENVLLYPLNYIKQIILQVCLLKKQLLSKDEYHKRELNKFKVSLLSKKIPKDKSCQTNFHASDKYIG